MSLSLLLSLISNNLEFSKRIWQKYKVYPWPPSCSCFQPSCSPSSKSFLWNVGKNNSIFNLGLSLEPATEIFQTIQLDSKDVMCMWFPGSGLFHRYGIDISTLCLFSSGSISCQLLVTTKTKNYSHPHDEGSPSPKHLGKGLPPIHSA